MKNRTRAGLAGLLLVALIALGAGLRVAAYAPLPSLEATMDAGASAVDRLSMGHPWRGAIHVHSRYSDGAGDVTAVMEGAAAAGVDFLILTDHNPIAGESRATTGWHEGVFLIVGEEISTEAGHLLAFQVPPHRYRFGPTARQALADIQDEGGWAVVAHPEHDRQPWTGGWGGSVGVEVANLAAFWSRSDWVSAAAAVASSVVDRDYAALRLLGTESPALRRWDSLTRWQGGASVLPRPRVAIGAADAHGPILGPLSAPSYADTLAVLNTLVWIDEPVGQQAGDPRRLEAKLLTALRDGRAAVEVTAAGDGRSFSFAATSETSARGARMGDLVPWEAGPWTLRARFDSPGPFTMVLLRDGATIAESDGGEFDVVADRPGTYRVEIFRTDVPAAVAGGGSLPWLVGNPIYIWPTPALTTATVRRAPPLPAPPLSEDLLESISFEVNESGVARNELETRRERVVWRITLDAEPRPDDFAALAWRTAKAVDWSAADGLVVQFQSGQTLRANVEVRTETADGAAHSWLYSIKASPDSDAVAIPWERFRTPWQEAQTAGGRRGNGAETRHATAEEMIRVRALFFVITPAALAPGSRARLILRTLGLYRVP